MPQNEIRLNTVLFGTKSPEGLPVNELTLALLNGDEAPCGIEKYRNKYEGKLEISRPGLLRLWHTLEDAFEDKHYSSSMIRKEIGLEEKLPTYM